MFSCRLPDSSEKEAVRKIPELIVFVLLQSLRPNYVIVLYKSILV